MNKKIMWLVLCSFVVLLIGGSILFLFKDSPKCGLLKINGDEITKENVLIFPNYAELPLTEIMKSLGMKVDWVDKSTAEITYKEKIYILNISKVSLIEVGQGSNLLLPPPGGKRYYRVIEKELIIDSNTIKSTMCQMGIKINIDINRKEEIVYIIDRIV